MTNPLTKEEMDEIKARVNRGAAYPLEIRQCRALISALESAWTERDELNLERTAERKRVSIAWVIRDAVEKLVADEAPLFQGDNR